jgi:taurine transport system ATP-binding protein
LEDIVDPAARRPSPGPAADVIAVRRLSLTYGRGDSAVVALHDISFRVPDSSFVVVVGPSGCGKSTLLKILAGLLPPTEGAVELKGLPIAGPRRDIGVVFQSPVLFPWRTVVGNVMLPADVQRLDRTAMKQRAHELLKLVGLGGFERRYPRELSGGMQQRVGIARALASGPEVLLMDEPLGALDALTREQLQELILDVWHRTGNLIFFITHSVEEAIFLATRLIVMTPRPGKIEKTYDLDFGRRFIAQRNARTIKSDPDFIAVREQVLADIRGREVVA